MSPHVPLSSSAARARRYRERKREGVHIIPVEVYDDEIDGLVEYGLLDDAETRDRHKIAAAIETVLFGLTEGVVELADE